MPKPLDSSQFYRAQHGLRITLKRRQLKIGIPGNGPKSALGAGGRAFKSPRPDQFFQYDAAILSAQQNLPRPSLATGSFSDDSCY